jgi:hypothetical protein
MGIRIPFPRKPNMNQDLDLHVALRDAQHPRAVMDAVLVAIDGIPLSHLRCLPTALRPRSLHSRADVEHWGRRLDTPQALEQPARPFMRAFFTAALLRLDEIGPARRPRAA